MYHSQQTTSTHRKHQLFDHLFINDEYYGLNTLKSIQFITILLCMLLNLYRNQLRTVIINMASILLA
jgi:hypothetical protein